MFLSLTHVKISNKDFNWKEKKKDYCLIIVGVETTRLYIYHFASSVSNCVVFCLSSSCVLCTQCCQFLWIVNSVSLTFIKSFYLLSSNVWFSDVPDKDKGIDAAAMYVILYFIKWRNENKIEKFKVLFTQYEFRDNFFAFFILMNSHGNEANVYEI